MFPVFGTNGDKIGRVPSVIPILQSGRRNAVFILKFIAHYHLQLKK
jgi:hypothetical protein